MRISWLIPVLFYILDEDKSNGRTSPVADIFLICVLVIVVVILAIYMCVKY